ncbi:hypothetical protein WAX78_15845 [Bacillus sp. FJAT-53711]|uniref:Uncharacterized protein n=1 Tax=Bacillus yunxiaonensis TaxID=3127665 RepID=A0ABU8FSJ7_9BACI
MSKIYRLLAINLIFLHQNPKVYTESGKEYDLAEAKTARYVKIVQSSGALTNAISFTGAEIYLFEDTTR